MLQQTQVSRVVDRHEAFLTRFPTPADLAAADEQEVLARWQGLGYYRRARLLHESAKMIVERFQGRVPREAADLRELPGVGRYTAGAIASIVFGRAEPIVDGNVRRVLARLEAFDSEQAASWTWDRAASLVAVAEEPGRFNEALMELGSTICVPRNPRCPACPLARQCKARRGNLQHEIPPPKAPPKRKAVHHHAVVIRSSRGVLVEQRPPTGLWAGMWQVPTVESDHPLSLDEVASKLSVNVSGLANGGSFEHHTSHRRITFHVLRAASRSRSGAWHQPDELSGLPMSNAQRRVLREFVA